MIKYMREAFFEKFNLNTGLAYIFNMARNDFYSSETIE